MNRRLKELAEKAGCSIDGMGYGEGNIEGLAELIVRECIDNVAVWEKDSRNHISYMLKRHFGVEE